MPDQLLKCRDRWLDLSKPKIMGIINLTMDSFYEASRMHQPGSASLMAEKMVNEGADIIDLGAMSSRPGAKISSPQEELNMLLPVLEKVLSLNVPVSIDTIHSAVASECLKAGVHIINDITSGEYDDEMINVVASYQCAYVAMHMRGTPETMKKMTNYPKGVVAELLAYFYNRIKLLTNKGVNDIVVDPGFGFSKSIEQNYKLLKRLESFRLLGKPLLSGVSRKSMIWKTLNVRPEDALTGTIALNTLALQNGADILRVHDVKEAVETLKIWNTYCMVN
jgi:dihydropteroate synthase